MITSCGDRDKPSSGISHGGDRDKPINGVSHGSDHDKPIDGMAVASGKGGVASSGVAKVPCRVVSQALAWLWRQRGAVERRTHLLAPHLA